MQIHELNNFSGTLGAGSYLAIDNGTDTGRISSQGLLASTEARIDTANDQITDLKSELNPIAQFSADYSLANLAYPVIPFEIGNIAFTSSGWNYSSNTKRVRVPEGKGFRVDVGDLISLTSYTDARFYMGILADDGTYHNKGWNTADVLCDYAGTCVLLVSNITEVAQTDVSDLASLVRVTKYNSLPVDIYNIEDKASQIGTDALNTFSILTYAEIPFEYGDITESSEVYSYPYSVNCLRTKASFSLYLNVGDKVYLTDYTDAKFSAYFEVGGDIDLYEYRVSDLTITKAGEYKFRIKNSTSSNIYSPLDLIKLFRVKRGQVAEPHYTYNIYPIKGVSHRGVQYQAPENTMSAFKLSVVNGFKYIETDVQFSSDGIPVLIHDTTVDRTTNGSGNVADMTYAQLRALDAGSWFSSEFAGEKIPSLEEFLIFCKRTRVYPYLELKLEATYTQAQVNLIVSMLKHYDMLNSVSWISWSNDWLNMIIKADKTARVGRARNIDISSSGVTALNAFKTGYNRVFWLYNIDPSDITLTDAGILNAKAENQDIEIATVSTETDMNTVLNSLTESGYISGCFSNGVINFADVVKAKELA